MPSNYPDGVSGSHPYFNPDHPDDIECRDCGGSFPYYYDFCPWCGTSVNEEDPDYGYPVPIDRKDPVGFDLNPIERLAVAQSLFKAVGSMVKTGDPCNLRGRVDAEMARQYETMKGVGMAPKSFDMDVMGHKVGTYSITTSKPQEESTRMELAVENEMQLLEWACANGFATVDARKVDDWFASTGEVPPGCTAVPVTVPAVEGGAITKTTLRIDPSKVADALGRELLGRAVRGFLTNGGE